MKKFWLFFLKKWAFATFILIFLIFFGVISLLKIAKESAPEVKIPVFTVSTEYPGAPAVELENKISKEIEDKLFAKLDHVKKISSFSRDNHSLILVEFNSDSDPDKAFQDLKDAVDEAQKNLPSSAKKSVSEKIDFASLPVLSFSLYGKTSDEELYAVAEHVKDELEKIEGVSKVLMEGVPDEEFSVLLSRKSSAELGISSLQLASLIKKQTGSTPLGKIESDDSLLRIRSDAQIKNEEDLKNLQIPAGGRLVPLSQIAKVEKGRKEADVFSFTCNSECVQNRMPAEISINMHVLKSDEAKITELSKKLLRKLEELKKGDSWNFRVIFDRGSDLSSDLQTLSYSGLQTAILIFLILFAAVGLREASVAALSIPLSFLIAFIGLFYSGYTLNFVSLFALVLSMGIIVDSGIVVLEAANRYLKSGASAHAAAERAVLNFYKALSSGNATTALMFLPLLLVSGVVGKFIASIPVAVTLLLLSSVFVSLAIVPMLSALLNERTAPSGAKTKIEKFAAARDRFAEKLEKAYAKILNSFLRFKKAGNIAIFSIILLFLLSLAMPASGIMKVVFFGAEDNDYIFVDVETPPEYSLKKSNLKMAELERKMLELSEHIEYYIKSVGISSAFSDPWGLIYKEENRGNLFIKLKEDRKIKSEDFANKLREKFSKVKDLKKIKVDQQKKGAPTLAPIMISIYSDYPEELEKAAAEVVKILKEENASEIESRGLPSGTEISLKVKKDAPLDLLTLDSLNAELAAELFGASAGKADDTNGSEINVYKDISGKNEKEERYKTSLQEFMQKELYLFGKLYYVSDFFKADLQKKYPNIMREKNKRVVQVLAKVKKGENVRDLTLRVQKRVKEKFAGNEKLSFSFEGENADIEQSFKDIIFAFFVGVLGMFAVLLLHFNSFRYAFIILLSVPLAIIGVFFGFVLTQIPFSFPAMMGLSALSGIVVNNAIILIDSYEKHKKEEKDKDKIEILTLSAQKRLRPIILTTLTTVIGVIPLLFSAAIWVPFAVSVIFGLTFSALLTLFFTPLLVARSEK